MKRIFLLFVIVACGGGTTTDDDAGKTGDSGSDAVANDSSPPNDSAITDSPSDVVQSGGDGGLGSGQVCDPQNNQCQSGLLCCSEPTHMADAMTGFFCEQPQNQQCPKLP